MRTDPRADEVRGIVERVFSGYLKKHRSREAASQPLTPCSRGDLPAGRLRFEYPQTGRPHYAGARGNAKSSTGKFPRLYEPTEEDVVAVLPEIDETILIDQGRYVARSYRTEGYMAMWLVPVGIVQFYDDRGKMLTTINLFESLPPQRMAS